MYVCKIIIFIVKYKNKKDDFPLCMKTFLQAEFSRRCMRDYARARVFRAMGTH